MAVFRDLAALRHWRQGLRGSLALVPTMGNLHEGHLSLVRLAQTRADHVLVSIYVNPLQFGRGEDFAAYPRTLDQDLAKLQEAGCNAIFTPDDSVMYPRGRRDLSLVMPARSLSKVLCGAHRPGHFAGVCTVVAKLLHMSQPQLLVLGEKDYQQYRVLQRMATDLDLPVQVVAGPTQRAADGLALSSRNRYLSPDEHSLAPRIFAALRELAQHHGAMAADLAASAAASLVQTGIAVEYLEFRAEDDLRALSRVEAGGRWFIAARLGSTRLIDNVGV
ncbi:pantoate--beta-alanine ligase [Acidithiobacillus caldus]|uniref:Pantothenate synthetase n=1 Tax=Acidithiobacillus caldus TaxID=33059 RepID=A0A1E7YKD9_9PROT|nr:pantoate--beta-alanine ligase [Acidithiobacillus caldus]OFC30054.1 pantoate--beta-alanine ligase [Acidithiobacillus caldus]OFC39135.1 pantoate--beta-alanine ligase [Acidithiobacillus caldus]OFC41953.1 pantoate--beta-alanine ligase [Acidithiobacillus caldus]